MIWGLMTVVSATGTLALRIDATGIHPTTALFGKLVICYGIAYVVME
jgi:hypothetical protein